MNTNNKKNNKALNFLGAMMALAFFTFMMVLSGDVFANEAEYHQNRMEKMYNVVDFFSATEAEEKFCGFVMPLYSPEDNDLTVVIQDGTSDGTRVGLTYDGIGWILEKEGYTSVQIAMTGSGLLNFDLGHRETYDCSYHTIKKAFQK